MALLQIAEPGAVSEQRRERQIGVGIDLGTTNSLIAHFDGEQLCVVADESGETALPSVVHYGVNETLVGRLELSRRPNVALIRSPRQKECWVDREMNLRRTPT